MPHRTFNRVPWSSWSCWKQTFLTHCCQLTNYFLLLIIHLCLLSSWPFDFNSRTPHSPLICKKCLDLIWLDSWMWFWNHLLDPTSSISKLGSSPWGWPGCGGPNSAPLWSVVGSHWGFLWSLIIWGTQPGLHDSPFGNNISSTSFPSESGFLIFDLCREHCCTHPQFPPPY